MSESGVPASPPAEASLPPPPGPHETHPVHEPPFEDGARSVGRVAHEPFLRRLRKAGHDPNALRNRARTWLYLGAGGLIVLAMLPILAPQFSTLTERVCTLLSLIFLMAAIGLWLGMRGRAFAVATAFVLSLYTLTFWTRLAFPLQDFFVVAILVSFAIFALAGFNLVFLLEEIVYDAHVRIHVAGRAWASLPTVVVLGLAVILPLWRDVGGPSLPALWTASIVCAVLLVAWWFVAWANDLQGHAVLRELHVFVIGALGATAIADGVSALNDLAHIPSLVPSLIAYLVLIGTWVYTSYTTLQRTHFLLRGDNWRPWVAILLGASFAILAHAQVLVAQSGTSAVADLVDLRIAYVVAGVWIGIAFYAARGLNRVLRFVLETRGLSDRSTRIATRAEKVAGGLMGGERIVGGAAVAVFRGLDTVIPGAHRPPRSDAGKQDAAAGDGPAGELRP